MAAHIPNLRVREEAVPTFPYIDNLFDYGIFLAQATPAIGTLPPDKLDEPIGIVGAGIGGLIAAYELLRAGARNLTILEASNRAGGRLYTSNFQPPSLQKAELGAMRFPQSEFGLFYYLTKFNIPWTENFPDPGRVNTEMGYQGKTLSWPKGGEPPAIFDRVNNGWGAFVKQGFQVPNGPRLAAPATITGFLRNRNLDDARVAWQQYINVFENSSFYNGLVTIFSGPNAPGGQPWVFPGDYQLFGALGLGSGGFGPLYPIGFLELVRLIVNELETSQQFVPGGIEALSSAILNQSFNGRTIGERVRYRAQVVKVQPSPSLGLPVAILSSGDNLPFSRLIFATTNRAAEIDADSLGFFLHPQEKSAVGELHLTSSSKVFVRTATKFWLQNPDLPQNIQTDTLVRGVYCLDYTPGRPNDPGVVLLSYTWEDDSIKQLTLADPRTRVLRLVADVAKTNSTFASFVVPAGNDYVNNVRTIDWDLQPGYYGAFKLDYPGTDGLAQQMFFQFQSSKDPATDRYVYVAGDSYSYTGGWVEGAIQTGLNAACAVIQSLGGKFIPAENPINNMNSAAYNYYPQPFGMDYMPRRPHSG